MLALSYVNIFVDDLAAAVDFYRGKLGLELQHQDPEHGYASLAAGAVRIGLARVGAEHRDLVGRMTGVGLAVSDLQAEYERLSALGATFSMAPTRQPWGGFMALLQDPAGNTLYLDEVAAVHATSS